MSTAHSPPSVLPGDPEGFPVNPERLRRRVRELQQEFQKYIRFRLWTDQMRIFRFFKGNI